MYRYNNIDQAIVDARVVQFADQTSRYIDGAISEDEFKPLRLQNGVYIERHSPLLRVAIPYGLLIVGLATSRRGKISSLIG
jgi:sulfite reductase (NADPH) hemoprotein beta-component